jgi:hypothetical protein
MAERARERRRSWPRAAAIVAVLAACVAGLVALTSQHPSVAASRRGYEGEYPIRWLPAGPLPARSADLTAARYYLALGPSPIGAGRTESWQLGAGGISLAIPDFSRAFSGVAAAGDDRTFLIALLNAGNPRTQFMEVQLNRYGGATPLSILPVGSVLSAGHFALSPDGNRLAVVTGRSASVITVFTRGARMPASWRGPATGHAGTLAWAGDRQLAYTWTAGGPQPASVRLLDTAAAGGGLLPASRLLLPATTSLHGFGLRGDGGTPMIASADGSAIFLDLTQPRAGLTRTEIVRLTVRTGALSRAGLPPATAGTAASPWCGPLWTNPAGSRVAVACGQTWQGVVANGQFTYLNLHDPRPRYTAW